MFGFGEDFRYLQGFLDKTGVQADTFASYLSFEIAGSGLPLP